MKDNISSFRAHPYKGILINLIETGHSGKFVWLSAGRGRFSIPTRIFLFLNSGHIRLKILLLYLPLSWHNTTAEHHNYDCLCLFNPDAATMNSIGLDSRVEFTIVGK